MATRRRRTPSMYAAVTRAVAAMHWLTPADDVAVDLALNLARQIDDAAKDDSDSGRKMVGWMGSHLTGLLKQLGGTPAGRKELAVEEAAVKGRLAELRAVRGGRTGA